MAVTADVRLTGHATGFPSGAAMDLAAAWTIPNGTGFVQVVALIAGDTTITIPSGSTLLLFVPPPATTATLTLKGAPGDTGIRLAKTRPTLLAVDATVTTVVVTASAPVAGCEVRGL